MTTFTHELAISAVPYDVLLVADLTARLAPSLGTVPYWRGSMPDALADGPAGANSALGSGSSRLALVLHQRLWHHDDATRADALALRQRVRRHAQSVRVVTLDAEPLPDWLAELPRCSLGDVGLDGVASFAIDAVVACGGSAQTPSNPVAVSRPWDWADTNRPYLTQPRALTALRREFEALADWLSARVRSPKVLEPRPIAALHSAPNRIVAQLETVGLSFSWIPGRKGTVADGRLMVIEWEGNVTSKPGMGTLKTASPLRERSYVAEATGPGDWRWRADDSRAAQYTTAHLAAQWLAGASLADGASVAPIPR